MNKIFLLITSTIVFFASCSKNVDNRGEWNTFSAKINETSYSFIIESGILLRFPNNDKRLEITGISTDGTTKLIISLGEFASVGNGISIKDYTLRMLSPDNPVTPADESVDSGHYLYFGKKVGNDWDYSMYSVNGIVNISACNEGATTISGTFQVVLDELPNDSPLISITNGNFNNLKYTVRII